MQSSPPISEEELLKQHYSEQAHYGNHGTSKPDGYPGTSKPGQQFHSYQGTVSRFTNNVGVLSVQEQQRLQANPTQFWQTYYNTTSLGVARAFEGPSPLSDRSEHVVRFLNSLYQNNIGAHVGAGNPLSGAFTIDSSGLFQLSNRGFFDITAIPPHYLDPRYDWRPEHIAAAKQEYMNRLWNNSEIQKLREAGYTWDNGLGSLLNDLTNQFFETLDHLKQSGIHIEVSSNGGPPGAERYQIDMMWNGYAQQIDYLALSHWDDFEGMAFTSTKVAAITQFYLDNHQQANFGVNCAAGLGRTGVMAMAFDLLSNHDQFFEADGKPRIDRIDEHLARMRTERPGIIQNHEQYTLAISLAIQMKTSIQYGRAVDDDYIKQVGNYTKQVIVEHQLNVIYQRQLQVAMMRELPVIHVVPETPAQQTLVSATHVQTPDYRKTPQQMPPTLDAFDSECLKKSKLSTTKDRQNYAQAISKLINSGDAAEKALATKLLSKLSVHDRRSVLENLQSTQNKAQTDFVKEYQQRSRRTNFFDSVHTRRKELNSEVELATHKRKL